MEAKKLLPRLLPYWVKPAGVEGMTFQQAPPCHHDPPHHSMPLNGILRVHGTGRMESACRSQQRRHADSVGHQEHDAQSPQHAGSPKRANRCLCNVLRHMFFSSAKGRVRHSRFGNTRNAYPGLNAGRTERPNSRKRRFARFRETAVPNRRPITIPIIASWDMSGQIWRLNNPVETRRPIFLMCWMSRLRFKKNGTGP